MAGIRGSIKAKLITINIVTLVIAILITAAIGYYKAKDILVRNMEQTLTSVAISSSKEVGMWIDSRKSELALLANVPLVSSGSNTARLSFLSSEIQRNKLYETFFISDKKGDYIITSGSPGNVNDRDYFRKVMSTGEMVVSDPLVSRATGKTVVVVASPLKKDGVVTGLLGGTVTIDDISLRVASIKTGKTGYAYMVRGDGLVIAHPSKDQLMKLNTISDPGLDQNLKDSMQRVTRGETGINRYVFEGVDKYVAYNPIAGVNWGIGVTAPVEELSASLWSLPFFTLGIAALVALISSIISIFLLSRLISKPIDKIRTMIAHAEKGDLTVRGQVNSEDELGQLTWSFNQFMEKIQHMLIDIRGSSVIISNSLREMSSMTGNMAARNKEMNTRINVVNTAVGQITENITGTACSSSETSNYINMNSAALEDMYNSVQKLASASEQISASLEQVTVSVEQNSDSISKISNSSQDMSASVNSVATAVKEINFSLNEVSRNCERSIQITDNAGVRATETRGIIGKLNDSSKQIGKIVNVINDIAEQTKMLTLNAAIEAAGAGEAGRGFAVVANEVKELAKQTAEATDEISLQIEAMQGNMVGAVQAVETITRVIDETTDITNTIASAVTQQSASTGEISKSIILAADKVHLITREISDAASNARHAARNIDETSKGLQEVARSINELSISANEASDNTTKASDRVALVARDAAEISRGAVEISQSIQEISLVSAETAEGADKTSKSARDLADVSQKMESQIQQFRV